MEPGALRLRSGGLQRVSDGVLHGLQSIVGARSVSAAALSDVVLAAATSSKRLARHAYQIAGIEPPIASTLRRHNHDARLVDRSANDRHHRWSVLHPVTDL